MFISKRGEFYRKNDAFKDMVQGRMALHIEQAIKTTAGTPVKQGLMKSDTRHFKAANGHFRVESDKAYAAYQERGMRADGSHRVRNYTTAGTSAGWFRRAINSVVKHKQTYILEARRALNL